MSMMELNAKSPVFWDWEDQIVFPSRAVTKKTSLVDSEIEATSGFEAGSLHSSGGGSGDSAALETSHSVSEDFHCRKELVGAWPARTPSMTDISKGSGESLIGLKLGKRTYFEAVSGGSNTSKTAQGPASSNATVKRSKSSSQSTEFPHCQVFGCNLDLSSAKDYHRKHRVCETHTKSSKVIIRGLERRFCQQCSRFHSLSEFDQKKRSCRRRLSDHNARRRKPKPEIIQFSSVTLHSSLHEGRNQINFAFNQVPLVQTRPDSSTKLIQGRVGLCSPMKTACSDELQATWNKPQETGFKVSYGNAQPSRFKEAPADAFHQGLQALTTASSKDAVQDLRALSLLSTNSWGSGVLDTTPPPLQNYHRHSHSLGLPAASTDYWEHSSHRALSLLSSNSWGSCEPDPTPPSLDESGMLLHHQYRSLGLPTVSGECLQQLNESSFYLY